MHTLQAPRLFAPGSVGALSAEVTRVRKFAQEVYGTYVTVHPVICGVSC